MTNPGQIITLRLRSARRRMLWQSCLDCAAKATLLAAALLVVVAGLQLATGARLVSASAVVLMLGVAAGFGAVIALLRAPSVASVASRLDALAGTRDRFTTALALASWHRLPADAAFDAGSPVRVSAALAGSRCHDAFAAAALAECGRFAEKFNPAAWLRVRLPRDFAWLAVPLVCIALLQWQATQLHKPRVVDAAALAEAREKSASLRELAAQLAVNPDPALCKLAEEMRRASERIEQPQPSDDPLKNALRELSALEAAIRAAQGANGPAPELAALAEALKLAAQSGDAADAMGRGDFEKAAAQIEQAAADPDAREKLAQALRDAMEKMQGAQGGELLEQLERAAQSAQQRSQALQRLAEMLRQMGGGGQRPQQSRGGISEKNAQQLLSMLQDMKSGQRAGQRGGKPAPGNFAPSPGQQGEGKDKPSVAIMGSSDIPSGRPGSEHDLGTTETPFGKEQTPKADVGKRDRLEGVLGEGESLQSLVSAAGGAGKARQRYRALYDAMAPDAEQAVARENIPPGSRFFVRRYFETIRPAE